MNMIKRKQIVLFYAKFKNANLCWDFDYIVRKNLWYKLIELGIREKTGYFIHN